MQPGREWSRIEEGKEQRNNVILGKVCLGLIHSSRALVHKWITELVPLEARRSAFKILISINTLYLGGVQGGDLPSNVAPGCWGPIAVHGGYEQAPKRLPQWPTGPHRCGSQYPSDLFICHCLSFPSTPATVAPVLGLNSSLGFFSFTPSLPTWGQEAGVLRREKKGVKWLFRLWESKQLKKCQKNKNLLALLKV